MEAIKEAIVSQLNNTYVLIGAIVIGLAITTFVYFKVFVKPDVVSTEEFVSSPMEAQQGQHNQQELSNGEMEQPPIEEQNSYDQ